MQRPRHGPPGSYGTKRLAHRRRRFPPFRVGLLLIRQALARGELLPSSASRASARSSSTRCHQRRRRCPGSTRTTRRRLRHRRLRRRSSSRRPPRTRIALPGWTCRAASRFGWIRSAGHPGVATADEAIDPCREEEEAADEADEADVDGGSAPAAAATPCPNLKGFIFFLSARSELRESIATELNEFASISEGK